MNNFYLLLLFIFIISTNLIYSQTDKDSLTLKYFEVIKQKELYETEIALMLIDQIPLNDKDKDIFGDFIWKHYSWDSVKHDYVKIYSEELTSDELRELINFYETPAGKKLIAKLPIIYAKILRTNSKRSQEKLSLLNSLVYEESLKFLRDTSTYFLEDFEPEPDFHDITYDTLSQMPDENDCLRFHKGKFVVKNDTSMIIIRDGNLQHEIIEHINSDAEFKIEWVSNCEYNLIFERNKNKKLSFYKPGDVINVKIISVKGNAYDCIVNSEIYREKITLLKIE